MGNPATAQLLTLFCNTCGTGEQAGHDIPLVSVLRDTLGQESESNHRLTAVWLLTYSDPALGQRALAAIPFFYWKLNSGSSKVKLKDTSPLLDLASPQHPAAANLVRQLLQWTALDAGGLPLRASSRAYRTNEVDHERLHLEEANSYLLRAPVGNGPGELTSAERDFVMTRLELRKKLLGGFVSPAGVATLGRGAGFEQERIRARNWELLRQCAEKTGLVFEPLTLASSDENYGMLWYPAGSLLEPGADNVKPIWKLLDIRDPYSDDRLSKWTGLTTERFLDAAGSMLPAGDRSGVKVVKLIPLGVYSLSYPRQPLLLVDFRDKLNLRRHDLTQKAINEVTSGIVGLSHFTNWYYFVASDAFNFVQERRGKANNRAERLDSYSEFRVSLAFDRSLDPSLRRQMEERAGALFTNPLESTPGSEMSAAVTRYSLLTVEALGDGSRLLKRINDQRREEVASFGSTPLRQGIDIALHAVTLGKYTHRASREQDNLALLRTYRRLTYNLNFLDMLASAGTPPEVSYRESQLSESVEELGDLMPEIVSPAIRAHVQSTLATLATISQDMSLRAQFELASQRIKEGRATAPVSVPGVLASPLSTPLMEQHR